MGRFFRDLWGFMVGAWGALTLAAMSFVDPLKALEAIGVDLNIQWPVTPDERRAIFLALSFLWMFVWFSRARHRYEIARFQPAPDMPLHIACRWIAKDSVWANQFDCNQDDRWVTLVDEALMTELLLGRVSAFGRFRPHGGGATTTAYQKIPLDFLGRAQWHSPHLVTRDAPTHMWRDSSHGGGIYLSVMLNRTEVEWIWPRKPIWARLLRRSPVERIGDHTKLFREQDDCYRKFIAGV